ncbi:MAG: hypothetical protein N2Z22_03080 [Turneriella sp.]|nr:hypothetical protein [Turneriella sp.]
MLVLFQDGIPDIFVSDLEKAGLRVSYFPTEKSEALAFFREHRQARAIFFRANFILDTTVLDALPHLQLAVLVSTGTDNVALAELKARGIHFVSGEGANAQAVCEYVVQALCLAGFDFRAQTLGIVGLGRIGGRLKAMLAKAGVGVCHYDPLLKDTGSLRAVLAADVVTFHTPLTKEGPHATCGMLGADYFAAVFQNASKKLLIIQTSRGGLWQTDFYRTLPNPKVEILAQDVYPLEPPSVVDVHRARYSTPHIAGYSTRGRLGGLLRGIAELLPQFRPSQWPQGSAWFLDHEAKRFAAAVQQFQWLRDHYPWRKEFAEYNAAERAEFLRRFPNTTTELAEVLFGGGVS